MGLSSRTILNIVELVYYGPALLVAIWIIKKHGMGRQLGWIYLAILAVFRIVGAAAGIAVNAHPSRGLFETSAIAYSVGLSPLLLAWLGIIKRVNEGMHVHSFPPRFINILNLPILVGLILGIVGGTNLYDTNPASVETGVTYIKASIILILVALIALCAISLITLMRIRHVMDGEKRLVFASVAVIPFLFVRIVYSIIVDFDRSSTLFNLTSDRSAAVVVQAVMSVAMEFVVVLIFLIAGFTTPVIPRSMVQPGYESIPPARQRKQRHRESTSRGNSPTAAYPLTNAAGSYAGRVGGQESGMTHGYSGRDRV